MREYRPSFIKELEMHLDSFGKTTILLLIIIKTIFSSHAVNYKSAMRN